MRAIHASRELINQFHESPVLPRVNCISFMMAMGLDHLGSVPVGSLPEEKMHLYEEEFYGVLQQGKQKLDFQDSRLASKIYKLLLQQHHVSYHVIARPLSFLSRPEQYHAGVFAPIELQSGASSFIEMQVLEREAITTRAVQHNKVVDDEYRLSAGVAYRPLWKVLQPYLNVSPPFSFYYLVWDEKTRRLVKRYMSLPNFTSQPR